MILSDDQRIVRDSVREFAQNELAPHAAAWDKAGALPDGMIAKMDDLGLLGCAHHSELRGHE